MRNFRGVMGQSVAAAATVETVQAGDGLSMVQAGVVVGGCAAHAGANYGARVGAQYLGVSNDTALLGVGWSRGSPLRRRCTPSLTGSGPTPRPRSACRSRRPRRSSRRSSRPRCNRRRRSRPRPRRLGRGWGQVDARVGVFHLSPLPFSLRYRRCWGIGCFVGRAEVPLGDCGGSFVGWGRSWPDGGVP